MPIYDYVCTQCGQRVEVIHGIHDAGPQSCDRCGGPMRKALSPPAIVFKGSGWAKVDARGGSRKAGDGAGESAEKDKTAKEAEGSTAKPTGSEGGGASKADTKAGTD